MAEQEPVIDWYRREIAAREWRNLLRYGSRTHRGQRRIRDLHEALRYLGESLGGKVER